MADTTKNENKGLLSTTLSSGAGLPPSTVDWSWMNARAAEAADLEAELGRLQSEQTRMIRECADALGVSITDFKSWAHGNDHGPAAAKIQRVIDAFAGARAYRATKAELTRLQRTTGVAEAFEGQEPNIVTNMLGHMLRIRGGLPVGSGGNPAGHLGLAIQALTLALDNPEAPTAKDAVSRALWRAAIALEGM